MIFLLFREKLNLKLSKQKTKIMAQISKYTFGIYLIHAGILEIFGERFPLFAGLISGIGVPVEAVIIFILSLIISAGLNSVPLLKQFIV